MAGVNTIGCRTCGHQVLQRQMLCPNCGQDPRVEPAIQDEPGGVQPTETRGAAPATESSSSSRTLRLILPNHEQVVLQSGQRVILGRESPNAVVARAFPAEMVDVSRHHVRLANDDGVPVLIMLGETGGTRGTFLDGAKLDNEQDARVPLHDGARFRLGKLAWCKVEVLN